MLRSLKGAVFLLLTVAVIQPWTFISLRNELLAQTPSKDAKVEVKVVKYDGLKEAVNNLKGRFVVVDFWSTT